MSIKILTSYFAKRHEKRAEVRSPDPLGSLCLRRGYAGVGRSMPPLQLSRGVPGAMMWAKIGSWVLVATGVVRRGSQAAPIAIGAGDTEGGGVSPTGRGGVCARAGTALPTNIIAATVRTKTMRLIDTVPPFLQALHGLPCCLTRAAKQKATVGAICCRIGPGLWGFRDELN